MAAERTVAGVMSGTSLDGIDVAIVRLIGSGKSLRWQPLYLGTTPYEERLRDRLFQTARARTVSVDAFVRLGVRLGMVYAEAVKEAVLKAGLQSLDAIGCHGQTVRHLPDPADVDGVEVAATAQIGSGPVLANLTGVVTVTDFRSADLALGGQGAPLVPYADWVWFAEKNRTVAALNIGGIANLTVLPGTDKDDIRAFDTGPGNMVIDTLVKRLTGAPFDEAGRLAGTGTVHQPLLESLLEHPFFRRTPPKSTGREEFGADYAARMMVLPEASGLSDEDVVATATELTAVTIAKAVRTAAPEELLISGGGVHNATLMASLRRLLPGVSMRSTEERGVDPDGKEAMAFAVLAHETLNGVPTGLPSVTGASRPAILGSVSYPS